MEQKEFYKQANEYLENWKNYSYSFEDIRIEQVKTKPYQKEVLAIIKNSVHSLDSLNSFLINHHPIISNNNKLVTFIKFHNNLMISKIKHFFFREKPKSTINEIDNKYTQRLYYLLSMIISEDDVAKLEFLLTKYFFYTFMMYDFLYSNKLNYGYFSRFKPSKDKFIKAMDKIKNILADIKTEDSFRKFANISVAQVLKIQFDISESLHTSNEIQNIFHQYIKSKKEKDTKVEIEPFSYYLAYIIWKYGNLIQRMEDKRLANIEKFKEFIFEYLEYILKSYDNEDIDFSQIYTLESDFLFDFDKDLQFTSLIYEIDGKISIENKNIENIKEKVSRTTFNNNSHAIKDFLEVFSFAQLNHICRRLFEKSSDQEDLVVGFYSGGVFLALLYSLFNNKNDLIFLQPFPFVDLHPDYLQNNLDNKKILIFDDSIKTGFTFSIFESVYFRQTKKQLKKYELLSLYYDDNLHDLTAKIDKKYILDSTIKDITTIDENFDIEYDKKENVISNIKKMLEIHSDKIDFSYFLSKKYFAFNISKIFADEIEKEFKESEKDKIYLNSPSYEANPLIYLVAYILKSKQLSITFNQKNIDKSFNCFIDFTTHTFYTIENRIEFLKLKKEQIDFLGVIKSYGDCSNIEFGNTSFFKVLECTK